MAATSLRFRGTRVAVPLNLKDVAAIDRLGASIFERWKKLDMLLGNAGTLGVLTPLTHLEPKVFQELMELNVTTNWRLIRSLDPLLKMSDAGRALFVSSAAAQRHTPFWGGYAMSKAALESLAFTYAQECAGTNVRVNVINPGPVRTMMRAKAMPGEDPSTLPRPEEIASAALFLASDQSSYVARIDLPVDGGLTAV